MDTFKVGDAVVVERGFLGTVQHSWPTTITRETPTRWVLGDGRMWIKKGTNVVLPKYIDYWMRARKVEV